MCFLQTPGAPGMLASSPDQLLAGTGDARRVSPSAYSLEQGGHRGDAPGPAWHHLGLPSSSLIHEQDPELSSSLPHGTCNFSRNCRTGFSRVISWFLLAKILKSMVSVKAQLSGPGDADLSCDLGLASPEAPSRGQMLQDRRRYREPGQPCSSSPRTCFFNAKDCFGGFSNLLRSGGAGQEPQPPSMAITLTLAHAASLQTSCYAWGQRPGFKMKASTDFSRA